ncbi:hypothetical protein SAY87_016152 [Trapa incisa]|uniref:Uncharacterized protein n=1 Tax=Trapa incisa TaxID=236973 RepID=A0AAN7QX84_9MYRT|nr:hypothetical protein SAY87_016152 [Trapa incisa]
MARYIIPSNKSKLTRRYQEGDPHALLKAPHNPVHVELTVYPSQRIDGVDHEEDKTSAKKNVQTTNHAGGFVDLRGLQCSRRYLLIISVIRIWKQLEEQCHMPELGPCEELWQYSIVGRRTMMTPNVHNMEEAEYGRGLNHVALYMLKQEHKKLRQLKPVDCKRLHDSNVHWFVAKLVSTMYNFHSHFQQSAEQKPPPMQLQPCNYHVRE